MYGVRVQRKCFEVPKLAHPLPSPRRHASAPQIWSQPPRKLPLGTQRTPPSPAAPPHLLHRAVRAGRLLSLQLSLPLRAEGTGIRAHRHLRPWPSRVCDAPPSMLGSPLVKSAWPMQGARLPPPRLCGFPSPARLSFSPCDSQTCWLPTGSPAPARGRWQARRRWARQPPANALRTIPHGAKAETQLVAQAAHSVQSVHMHRARVRSRPRQPSGTAAISPWHSPYASCVVEAQKPVLSSGSTLLLPGGGQARGRARHGIATCRSLSHPLQ